MAQAYTTPTQHQAYQTFPRLDAPFIDADGNVNIIWYRFLIGLFARTGQGFTQQQLTQVLQENPATGDTDIIQATTGDNVGTVVTGSDIVQIVSLALSVLTPPEQARPQVIPAVPMDQLHLPGFHCPPMDQLNMANIINHTLGLT